MRSLARSLGLTLDTDKCCSLGNKGKYFSTQTLKSVNSFPSLSLVSKKSKQNLLMGIVKCLSALPDLHWDLILSFLHKSFHAAGAYFTLWRIFFSIVFRLHKNPLDCLMEYWMSWKVTTEPRGDLRDSRVGKERRKSPASSSSGPMVTTLWEDVAGIVSLSMNSTAGMLLRSLLFLTVSICCNWLAGKHQRNENLNNFSKQNINFSFLFKNKKEFESSSIGVTGGEMEALRSRAVDLRFLFQLEQYVLDIAGTQ